MPVTIAIRPEETRQEGGNGYVERQYNAVGSDDAAEIKAQAIADIPSTLNGFPLQPLKLERKSASLWIVYAKYQKETQQPPPIQVADGWVYTYDTGETTVRITHGLTVAQANCNGNTAPDVGVGINVTDSEIQGIDVPVSAARLTRKGVFPKAAVSNAWLRSMANNAFRTNIGPWNGWGVDEVLYRKTLYADRLDGYVEITQEFDVGETVNEVYAGSDVALQKKPHQYRWVLSQRIEDAAAKRMTIESVGLYVNTVYKQLDFALLEPS